MVENKSHDVLNDEIKKICRVYAESSFELFKQFILDKYPNGKFKIDTIVEFLENNIGTDYKVNHDLLVNNINWVALMYTRVSNIFDEKILDDMSYDFDFNYNLAKSCIGICKKESIVKKRLQKQKIKLAQLEEQRVIKTKTIDTKIIELKEKIKETEKY